MIFKTMKPQTDQRFNFRLKVIRTTTSILHEFDLKTHTAPSLMNFSKNFRGFNRSLINNNNKYNCWRKYNNYDNLDLDQIRECASKIDGEPVERCLESCGIDINMTSKNSFDRFLIIEIFMNGISMTNDISRSRNLAEAYVSRNFFQEMLWPFWFILAMLKHAVVLPVLPSFDLFNVFRVDSIRLESDLRNEFSDWNGFNWAKLQVKSIFVLGYWLF